MLKFCLIWRVGTSFRFTSIYFWHVLFWPLPLFLTQQHILDSFVLSVPQPCNPFHQGAIVSLIVKQCLGARVWLLVCLLLLGWCCSQSLSVDTVRKWGSSSLWQTLHTVWMPSSFCIGSNTLNQAASPLDSSLLYSGLWHTVSGTHPHTQYARPPCCTESATLPPVWMPFCPPWPLILLASLPLPSPLPVVGRFHSAKALVTRLGCPHHFLTRLS